MRRIILPLFLIAASLSLLTSEVTAQNTKASQWADSVLSTLTTRKQIGQLMMVRTYSNRPETHAIAIDSLVINHGIGGVCFFQGTPYRQKALTNRWQSKSQVPMLVALDAETGPGMRLDSAFSYPEAMTLGAIQNDSLIRLMGQRIGRMMHGLGVHINFSPVADVNINPANPVIGNRSFSSSPETVAHKTIQYALGLQDVGILPTLKHFPGHGDTDMDSHYSLPVINKDRTTILNTEIAPFLKGIEAGVIGVMVGHLLMPAIDSTPNLPSSLSEIIITNLLKKELNFKGYIITDGLDMKGVTNQFPAGLAEYKSLLAGTDILLLPPDPIKSIDFIKKMVDSGKIDSLYIAHRCHRVLELKYKLIIDRKTELQQYNPGLSKGEITDISLRRELFRQSITLVTNKQNILPIKTQGRSPIAIIEIGDRVPTGFTNISRNYTSADQYTIGLNPTARLCDSLARNLTSYQDVIIAVANPRKSKQGNFGIPDNLARLTDSLKASGKRIILAWFGSPYALSSSSFPTASTDAIIVGWQAHDDIAELIPQMIFGAEQFQGKLPVAVNDEFPLRTGITTVSLNKLCYVLPEELGITHNDLFQLDQMVAVALSQGAFPGCQVELALKGKVFYQKAFGSIDKDRKQDVKLTNVYDLASLTKILGTGLALMKLTDQKRIDIDDQLRDYLRLESRSMLRKATLKSILAHEAGLPAFIPFYKKTVNKRGPKQEYYREIRQPKFGLQVDDSLWMRTDYADTIYRTIYKVELNKKREYLYSDLGMILMRPLIEQLTEMSLDSYLTKEFYEPLGLSGFGYLPMRRHKLENIAPTENDTLFRKKLVHGWVHDPTAAMLGGVSGHAGLFGTANDVTVIMQMLLQGGDYGATHFLSESVIRQFTSAQFPEHGNRRGLTFDRPTEKPVKDGPVCESASQQSFGHSGFTGTYTWADPANGLVYVFLSNRVNPNASNNQLAKSNLRTRIHQKAYEILLKAKHIGLTPEKIENPLSL
ncbi:MAG: serine hydrolase [Sphingobacteriia bacterium]|nr:serine hydrolase [Sphingobacteriia bacterium]